MKICSYCGGRHSFLSCPTSTFHRMLAGMERGTFSEPDGTPAPPRPALGDVVGRQVAALTHDLDDFEGKPELPRARTFDPPYAEAFAEAVRKCQHENVTNTLYMREWKCDDCGKYLDKSQMKRKGGLGWLFG